MESGAMAQLQALHTLQGMGGIQVHSPPPPPPPPPLPPVWFPAVVRHFSVTLIVTGSVIHM